MRQKKESLTKGERLCGIKAISGLFSGGRTISQPPLRAVFMVIPAIDTIPPVRVLISVPKRAFKKAVNRNLIRRRVREAWRKNKMPLITALSEKSKRMDLALLWSDNEIRPYSTVEICVKEMIQRLTKLIY